MGGKKAVSDQKKYIHKIKHGFKDFPFRVNTLIRKILINILEEKSM